MLWLIVAISAYFLFAIVALVDKYLLTGPLPNPKVYTFYVGILGLLVLLLAPFVGFYYPGPFPVFLAFLSGAFFIFGLFWFYKAIWLFEVSRVVPAVGGSLPIFAFLLVYIFSLGKEKLLLPELLALLLIVAGSILITYKRGSQISLRSFQISAIAAFFLALSFVLTKYVYLALPFWSGYIWKTIGGSLAALTFLLFSPGLKRELFKVKMGLQKKTAGIFLTNQAVGAGAHILQNWAIALAPLAYVAIINALQGTQHIFLLVFAVLLSWKFPKILKEEISRKILFQKIIAILLIGGGLTLLVIR